MSRIQGTQREYPFSVLAPSQSFILGRGGAADPNLAAHPGNTPGPTGVGGDYASMLSRPPGIAESALDFLVGHRVIADQRAQALCLDDSVAMNIKSNQEDHAYVRVWQVEGALLYRVQKFARDDDGGQTTYHPPTPEFWLGYNRNNLNARGLGRDSLLDAIGLPAVPYKPSAAHGHGTHHGAVHREVDWDRFELTKDCKLLSDLFLARSLKNSSDPSARTHLAEIFGKYQVTTMQELEIKGAGKVCIKPIRGRDFQSQLNDWNNVQRWAGIIAEHGEGGKPKVRTTGTYAGYYYPRGANPWVDPHEHPFLVRTKELYQNENLHLNFGVPAVVVSNGDTPKIAFALAGEGGPPGGFGECSSTLLDDLDCDENTVGDFICIFFPGATNARKRDAMQIRAAAESRFDSWTVHGRKGLEVIRYLFPTFKTYMKIETDYRRRAPGDIVLPRKSLAPQG
jgi:hypothetical protein